MTEVIVPVAFFSMIAFIVVGTPLARAYARRLDRQQTQTPLASDTVARLERIEQSLEAVATEVERISEGQRFTTKLLAETKPTGLPSSANAHHNAQ